jgi:hypothetical protein
LKLNYLKFIVSNIKYKIKSPVTRKPSDPALKSKSVSKPSNYDEYKCFREKLANFELPDYVNRTNRSKAELEIEKIKHFLSDLIFWTSINHSSVNDTNDFDMFKGYLLYLLNTKKQLESITTILKIFKRLIQTNGSFEWIETYKDICMLIQSDFFVEFDSNILIE